jgi:hypothetical protein
MKVHYYLFIYTLITCELLFHARAAHKMLVPLREAYVKTVREPLVWATVKKFTGKTCSADFSLRVVMYSA